MDKPNRLLKPNKGMKGSYTIRVEKGYGILKEPLSEVIAGIIERTRKREAQKRRQSKS